MSYIASLNCDMFPKRIKHIFTPGISSSEARKDGYDIKNGDGHTEANIKVSKDFATTSQGHAVSREARLEDDEVASRATQIVQVFSEENMCLRKQLEKYYQEIKHLKSVDKELRDTQIMYKDLKSAFIIREHKEKAMRSRMEAEIAQLQNTNADLTDELSELKAVLVSRPEKGLRELKDEINQRDDEVKQLQKERKISKTSLQNLERMLKQKSSEIIILQQQLETSGSICKICSSKQLKEEQDVSEKGTSGDYLEQFHESMMKSCTGRTTGTRFLNRSNNCHGFRTLSKQDDLDIRTCVPVLIELLKEKDTEIVKLRKEIDQETSRLSEITDNKWISNTVGERLPKHRYSKQRYSDLETEIRALHVQLAEKDAQIKILKCKYGESGFSLDSPLRIPSFTSQSSVSSYQDSGIMTASEGHYDEITCTREEENPEKCPIPLQKSDYDNGLNRRQSNKQTAETTSRPTGRHVPYSNLDKGEDETVLSDHCWFV